MIVTTSSLPSVLVSHSGKQHAYWHARSLQNLGALDRLVTSGYYKPDRWPDKLCRTSQRVHRSLLRRHHPELDSDCVIRRWKYELPELIARRRGKSRESVDRLVFERDAKFDQWVSQNWADRAEVFWGFQGSCLESLRAARAAGKFAVLELATVHVTAAIEVLQQEAIKHPEWAGTISNYEFPDWYRDRLEREPFEADLCVVASPYTKESLLEIGIPAEKIELLPLGAQLERFEYRPRDYQAEKLRVLFVGGIGQRKGIKYLLEAVQQLDRSDLELVLVGPASGDLAPLKQYAGCYTLLGRLDQTDVVREMQQSHVMVLPSVLEGFGLVIAESLATGLPVISSTHSAAPEIIRQGQDGYVLEPDDVEGIKRCLLKMLNNREHSAAMSVSAAERAKDYSWDRHQDRLEAILKRIPLGQESESQNNSPREMVSLGNDSGGTR